MDQHVEKIKAIEVKIQKLIEMNKNMAEEKTMFEEENKTLTEENKKLKEQLTMLEQQTGSHKEKLVELEEKNKVLNLATSVTEDTREENKFLKTRIDEYVNEIDKCLALLNN